MAIYDRWKAIYDRWTTIVRWMTIDDRSTANDGRWMAIDDRCLDDD
jgi:hypothetical protein